MSKLSIALDGPAGAGKSTIAKMIAQIKDLLYIDTGAMYRAITLKTIRLGITVDNIVKIEEMLQNTTIEMIDEEIYLDGEKVAACIRDPEINRQVPNIAKIPEVRAKMIELQREIAMKHNVIMDGRDIGTNVLPQASFKFFLTASLQERAKRRYRELSIKGYNTTLDEVKFEMQSRDKIDSEREIDPLRMAQDAIVVDTTNKNIEEVVNEILSYLP